MVCDGKAGCAMLRILLVDDDAGSMEIAKRALGLFPNADVVGTAASGMEAIEFVRDNPVDLVLLDIEMDEMNGFELASYIHNHYPQVQYVFVTGHTDFALDGYSYQPLSFLIKPISISRLERVLELAEERCHTKPEQELPEKQIGLHVDSRLEIISVSDVAYLETAGRKVRVVCKDGRVLETTESMKKLYQVFEDYGFYRSHQSFVVQLALIESISSDMFHRSYLLKLKGLKEQIPLSRDNYAALRSVLEQRGIKIF